MPIYNDLRAKSDFEDKDYALVFPQAGHPSKPTIPHKKTGHEALLN